MKQRRLLWYLFPSYLIITFLALIAATIYAYYLFSKNYIQAISDGLQTTGIIVEDQIKSYLKESNYSKLDSTCRNLGIKTDTRFTVILPDGIVVADSEKDPQSMDDHSDRPEIVKAINGEIGISIRYSQTLDLKLMYVALPILMDGETIGVLRTSVPLLLIDKTLDQFQNEFIIASIFIAFIVGVISLIVSGRISNPLENMRIGVEKFAKGQLSYRLSPLGSKEMNKLTTSLNEMAGQLDEKIKTIIEQKNEQEAVLESMVEGVIAIDNDGKIINLNKAAADFFQIDAHKSLNHHIYKVISFKDLVKLIKKTLIEQKPIEEEIVLEKNQKLYMQVHGAILKNASEEVIGMVIVLNDVTRLRRLEKVRRDFVANVSHEIRTPLTSIKGFTETLLNGALNDPKSLKRFLKIINKQSDRLNAIIEDLLILARLEQEDDERAQVDFNAVPIKKVLKSAIKLCRPAAIKKKVDILLEVNNISPKINPDLLEQAIVNLLDNAIKYSPERGQIIVKSGQVDQEVEISIMDQGTGIPKKHLPRLFERFYRVDKARSRDQGGTGLGLSIVKHITQIHGGRVEVDSVLGKGSTFNIYIPHSENNNAINKKRVV